MRTIFLFLVALFLCALPSANARAHADTSARQLPFLRAGTVVTASVTFSRGNFLVPNDFEASDGKNAAIMVRGDNIVVDFNGAVLRGTPETTEPDARKGVGVLVRGKNVTLRNLRVHGYKVGVVGWDSPGLKIENGDFSHNWKQKLQSTPERENEADWMSFHQNEKNEWLRLGAGIYLSNCDNFAVQNCRITGGQSGLMLTQCDNGAAWNNDFSFLSAIGVGLYRSSHNKIQHNKIDWCVRGYSHGVYNRGQDSAGILVYEQSSHNTFAYNSVTHGGDGFFLWAGQTTMDTGKGGCNDNLVYGNDFSHSPTNGIEITFSRNQIANNLLLECWHGVWGGYSYDTKLYGNIFGLNVQAVAIEHGQNNTLESNIFRRNNEGITLWQNAKQDPTWGYPKNHDTKSRDYSIVGNAFYGSALYSVKVRDTANVALTQNEFFRTAHVLRLEGDTPGLLFSDNLVVGQIRESLPGTNNTFTPEPLQTPFLPAVQSDFTLTPEAEKVSVTDFLRAAPWNPYQFSGPFFKEVTPPDWVKEPPAQIADAQNPFMKADARRGRRFILIDEWGPYDFQSPRLVPRDDVPGKPGVRRFEILGPRGAWRVKNVRGVALSARNGLVPGEIQVRSTTATGEASDIRIELEYVGTVPTTDYRGIVTPAQRPVSFTWSKFVLPIAWNVRWYKWGPETDPRTRAEPFAALITGKLPILTAQSTRLDYAGNGAMFKGLPADHYATVADGSFEVAAGNYTLDVTTDDGVRVWVDDKPVITEAWKYQGPTLYTAPLALAKGHHTVRVEHFQIDGYAALKVDLRPSL